MKIALIGNTERTQAWEKHLRKLSAVKEVILSPTLVMGSVDGCILLDDSINNLNLLFDSVRMGFHSYLVSQLPTDYAMVEKIYHASEEAEVTVQFSHWPSFSPTTLWIRQQMQKPDLIQIKKEISSDKHLLSKDQFDQQWIDELAFIIKFQRAGIQQVIARPIQIDDIILGLQLSLRFDDGSAASLQFGTAGKEDHHQRILSTNQMILDCDVNRQAARKVTVVGGKRIKKSGITFDSKKTVELSVLHFIQSIQQNKASDFSAYNALKTVQASEKIKANLERF